MHVAAGKGRGPCDVIVKVGGVKDKVRQSYSNA